jgi:hypothetical protein
MKMQHAAVERVVDDFSLLEKLALSEVDQLLAEMLLHIIAEDIAQLAQERGFVRRGKKRERMLVDVYDPNLAHAAGYELRMDVGEDAQIGNTAATDFVHQSFDAAEIFDPQRNG